MRRWSRWATRVAPGWPREGGGLRSGPAVSGGPAVPGCAAVPGGPAVRPGALRTPPCLPARPEPSAGEGSSWAWRRLSHQGLGKESKRDAVERTPRGRAAGALTEAGGPFPRPRHGPCAQFLGPCTPRPARRRHRALAVTPRPSAVRAASCWVGIRG